VSSKCKPAWRETWQRGTTTPSEEAGQTMELSCSGMDGHDHHKEIGAEMLCSVWGRCLAAPLKGQPEPVLASVLHDPRALGYAPEHVRDDYSTVLAAVRCCAVALRFGSPACRANVHIVSEAVKQDGEALRYAADVCKQNPQIVLKAVRKCPVALQFASEECRADRGIVMEAVRRDERALQYAASGLLQDETFAAEAKRRYYILAISALSGRTCCIALHQVVENHQFDVDLNVCILHQSCESLGIQLGDKHEAVLLHEEERVCSGTLLQNWPGYPTLGRVTKYQLLVTSCHQ